MQVWATILVAIAASVVGLWLIHRLVRLWAAAAYRRILVNPATLCDIDRFVNHTANNINNNNTIQNKNPVNAVKCVLAHKLQIGNRVARTTPIPLETSSSPHVPNLYVSRKQQQPPQTSTATTAGSSDSTPLTLDQLLAEHNKKSNSKKPPIVICTIRMGFGHHRLAYSVSSWAVAAGHTTIFHDLLNIQSGTCVYFAVCVCCVRFGNKLAAATDTPHSLPTNETVGHDCASFAASG